MKVKIIQNFYFFGKLFKMGTTAIIEEKYHELLKGKIEAIEKTIDYKSYTKKQLQELLDNQGVEYDTKMSKDKLISLIGGD